MLRNGQAKKRLAIRPNTVARADLFGSDVGQSSNRKAGVADGMLCEFTSGYGYQLTQETFGL